LLAAACGIHCFKLGDQKAKMNESFEEKLRRKRAGRRERRESTKLSARTLTAVVSVLTALYWVWVLAQPNPPAVSILAQFWAGVAMFCPLIALLLSAILLFGYMPSDPACEKWVYVAAFLTASMWIWLFVRPHESSPPGWVNP